MQPMLSWFRSFSDPLASASNAARWIGQLPTVDAALAGVTDENAWVTEGFEAAKAGYQWQKSPPGFDAPVKSSTPRN